MLSNSVRLQKGSERMPCQLAEQMMVPSVMVLVGYEGSAPKKTREVLASAVSRETGCTIEDAREFVARSEECAAQELSKA